jgi:hypothetical protein
LQAGISLVGVSRVLAGNSDSSGGSSGGSEADSLLHDLLSASSNSSSSSSWMLPSFGLQGVGAVGDAVTEGGGGGSDPKKALLGMLLIILSQVRQALPFQMKQQAVCACYAYIAQRIVVFHCTFAVLSGMSTRH